MSSILRMASAQLDDLVKVDQLVTYLALAAATVSVYDYVRSLDLETSYIWRARLSPIKVLYMWTRYQMFIDIALELRYVAFNIGLGSRGCYPQAIKAILYTNTLAMAISEITLFVRTWAVWDLHRTMGAILGTIWVTMVVASISFTFGVLRTVEIYPLKGYDGCILLPSNGNGMWLQLGWTMLLAGDSICIFFLILKFLLMYRTTRNLSGMIKVVAIEGIIYYIMILVATLAIIAVGQHSEEVALALGLPGRVLHSILVAHLILHTRQVADVRNTDNEMNTGLPLSTLRFGTA